MKYILVAASIALALTGCGMFGKPALPRRASMSSLGETASDNFGNRIKRADAIYYATEDLDRAVADLIRVLREEAKPFAIAWQDLGADQQQLLDQLSAMSPADPRLAGQVTWNVSARLHDSQRQKILEATADLPQLAIGLPKTLRVRLQAGRALTADERLLLPQGYRIPEGSSEHFSKPYRAQLIAKIFAAEKIVVFFQTHPGSRLLVFLHRRDLESTGSVPEFVTQKINAPQLILDPGQAPAAERPRLVTSLR